MRLSLTSCKHSLAENINCCGNPKYTLDRFTGFWWQPRSSSTRENVYSLLYEEVDEGGVEIVRILGFPCTQADLRPDVEEFR